MDDSFLTVNEVAALLRVSPATVRYWRGRGVGPASFKVEGRVVYRHSAVDEWVRRQENRPDVGARAEMTA